MGLPYRLGESFLDGTARRYARKESPVLGMTPLNAFQFDHKLVYTPMINAKMYADPRHSTTYRPAMFNTSFGEEGGPEDRPLFIQVSA